MPASSGAARQVSAITVIRPGALGDTLLALPALALLRAWAPGARLTFIARADVLPLAVASGLADGAWSWDLPDWAALFDPGTTAASLTDRARAALVGVDVVLAWAPDAGGALAGVLSRLGAARVIVAPPVLAFQGRDTDGGLEGGPVEHVALSLARALVPLGITSPDSVTALWRAVPTLRWPEASGREAERVWRNLGLRDEPVIAIHPGAGSAEKRWPPAHFAALAGLARQAGYTPLLLAGPADEEAVAATLAASAASLPVARGLDIAALAPLLARCAGYAGNDSGVTHLAGMLGRPAVALFGPTDFHRWSPLGPHVICLSRSDHALERLTPVAVWAGLAALISALAEES